jgi:hypothetical protein
MSGCCECGFSDSVSFHVKSTYLGAQFLWLTLSLIKLHKLVGAPWEVAVRFYCLLSINCRDTAFWNLSFASIFPYHHSLRCTWLLILIMIARSCTNWKLISEALIWFAIDKMLGYITLLTFTFRLNLWKKHIAWFIQVLPTVLGDHFSTSAGRDWDMKVFWECVIFLC